MSNEWIFFTQLLSLFTYVGIALGLYALLVKQKDATIQFLEAQLKAAKEDSSDVVLNRLSDRVQIARAEMDRLSKDKEKLTGMAEKAYQYIDALEGVVAADADLIKGYEKQSEEMHDLTWKQFETFTKDLLVILGKLEESGTVLVHKDADGVVQKVTFTPKETS